LIPPPPPPPLFPYTTLFRSRERRELRREVLITPDPDLGLVAMNGPNDPEPGLKIEQGRVVWLDGRSEEEFDAIDHFIARHGLDLDRKSTRLNSSHQIISYAV